MPTSSAPKGRRPKRRGVALCMDCRNHSMEFARAAAEVCAANGIHVRIFESLRPTPELSFAVREYGCQAGINVTASHNPKEYNGYKVYWSDGAQLPPQHAAAIARELEHIDIFTGVRRMEAFDISNISGYESVGSMVVYEDGRPKRSDYRKFRIRTVTGPNDYASMREVLMRRFTHGLEEMSQLKDREKNRNSEALPDFRTS